MILLYFSLLSVFAYGKEYHTPLEDIAVLTTAFIHDKMDVLGYADLLSFEDDMALHLAVQKVFQPSSLQELLIFAEKRSSTSPFTFKSPFEKVIKDTFQLEGGGDVFTKIVIKIRNDLKIFNAAMNNPALQGELCPMQQFICTQFYLMGKLTEDQARLLSPLLKFSNVTIVKFYNLLILNTTLNRQFSCHCLFIDFRGVDPEMLNGIESYSFTKGSLKSICSFLDVDSMQIDQLSEILGKVSGIYGLLLKFTKDSAVLEKVMNFPFKNIQRINLSWEKDADSAHLMEKLLNELRFKELRICDERLERFSSEIYSSKWINFRDSAILLSLPESLTDYAESCRSSKFSHLNLKPAIMELATHHFLSKTPRKHTSRCDINQGMTSMIIYIAYSGIVEDIFTLFTRSYSNMNLFCDFLEQTSDVKFGAKYEEFLRLSEQYHYFTLLSEKFISKIEDYLDFFDDWTMKSQFMDNSFETVMTALGFEESYLTIHEFLFKLIKSMRMAILQVLAASKDGNIEVDEMTKSIATPYFLWKYSSIDSTESAEAFMSISPFLKLDSVAKINIHDDWLKYMPPRNLQFTVDLLLIDVTPRVGKALAREEDIILWFQSEKMNVLHIRNVFENTNDILMHISFFRSINITGAVVHSYDSKLMDFISDLFGDSIEYLSLIQAPSLYDYIARFPKMKTLQLDDYDYLKILVERFKSQKMEKNLNLQISDQSIFDYVGVLISDDDYRLIHHKSNEKSCNGVSYAYLGVDARFYRMKCAAPSEN